MKRAQCQIAYSSPTKSIQAAQVYQNNKNYTPTPMRLVAIRNAIEAVAVDLTNRSDAVMLRMELTQALVELKNVHSTLPTARKVRRFSRTQQYNS